MVNVVTIFAKRVEGIRLEEVPCLESLHEHYITVSARWDYHCNLRNVVLRSRIMDPHFLDFFVAYANMRREVRDMLPSHDLSSELRNVFMRLDGTRQSNAKLSRRIHAACLAFKD